VPPQDCPYRREVRRKFAFLSKVRAALAGLQNVVDDMDPDFDPTAYYTDPEESRLCVADELLDAAGHLLHGGDSEEAEDLLMSEHGAHTALLEAFGTILDAGLDCCEADPPGERGGRD
jgi:hypothetical protein